MSEQVSRKKSYRWASASQTSYNGADWDSSGDEEAPVSEPQLETSAKSLPALPKLDYSKDEPDNSDDPALNEQDDPNTSTENSSMSVPTKNSGSTPHLKRSPTNKTVNDDLDNLMVQISKEMTPVVSQNENFKEKGDLVENKHDTDSEEDDHIPKEYFLKSISTNTIDDFIHTEDDDDDEDEDEAQKTDNKSISNAENNLNKTSTESLSENKILNNTSSTLPNDIDTTQNLTSDDDGIINIDSNDSEEDAEYIVPKDGYFSQILESEKNGDQNSAEVENELSSNLGKNVEISNIIDDDDDEKTDEKIDEKSFKSENPVKNPIESNDDTEIDGLSYTESITAFPRVDALNEGMDSDEDASVDKEEQEETASVNNESLSESENDNAETNATNTITQNPDTSSEGMDYSDGNKTIDEHSSMHSKDNNDFTERASASDSSSIKDETWKLDTDAFRSGFVQESNDKQAPEGFVVDENGDLVNLDPSGMQNGAPSTYTRTAESTWEAFPSGNSDDIETIRDTKTLYDNSTLYNVPGLITNNTNMPPLPEFAADFAKPTDESSTPTFRSPVTIPEAEFSKVQENKPVPYTDMNKIISSNTSHSMKLEQLNQYKEELNEYDSGLYVWINHSLTSSTNSDTNFIFEEYKVSEHVKHAYANADEISRKNTVINTVDTVTQNVSHLRKKVFSHSIKSKGLFASIGKKKL